MQSKKEMRKISRCLTYPEKKLLEKLFTTDVSYYKIAEFFKVHPSTIYRFSESLGIKKVKKTKSEILSQYCEIQMQNFKNIIEEYEKQSQM